MEKIKIKTIIAACILLLLFVACGKDDNPNEPKEGNQLEKNFPFLKIGNSWVYENYYHYYDGTIDTVECWTDIDYKFDFVLDDINYTKFFMRGQIPYLAINEFFASDSTVVLGSINLKELNHFPLFRDKYTVGQKWKRERLSNSSYHSFEAEREIVSIYETLTVVAGTFDNCIKIKETITNKEIPPAIIERFYWIRNDIGFIKFIEQGMELVELKSKNF